VGGLLGVALLGAAGCSTAAPGSAPGTVPGEGADSAAAPAPPPPPPAACLLDLDAMAAATGLGWTADATTASDTRCVYDPDPAPSAGTAPTKPAAPPAPAGGPGEFVAVDIAPAGDDPAAAQLDVLAEVCDTGSRTPTARGGFVCRFDGGSVYAGLVRGGDVITVAASAVPPGTTADALATAFGEQLDALG
jgi:hypothetical protein